MEFNNPIKGMKLKKVKISRDAKNAKVQNILGAFLILDAIIFFILMYLGYV